MAGAEISRRQVLGGFAAGAVSGAMVPAMFGGRISASGQHAYARLFETGFQPLAGGGIPFGRCGATHVGGGFHISAAHCGVAQGITMFRLDGRPVSRINGKYWIFGTDAYQRAGLIDDFLFIYDPASEGMPSIPIAPPEIYADLRRAVSAGEIVRALSVGYGTTRLDSTGLPTDPSSSLRELDVTIHRATTRDIIVADSAGTGGVCVGDSGSGLLYKGYLLGPTSSVMLNPKTGSYCDVPGWEARYKSLELQLDRIRDLRGAIAHFSRTTASSGMHGS